MSNHKPATALPFYVESDTIVYDNDGRFVAECHDANSDIGTQTEYQAAAYIAHAANAYPRLIEALRGIANDVSADFGDCPLGKVRALLAELGEE